MSDINLLARVYQCHPSVVGLPTTRYELYNPPPLTRTQVIPYSISWGMPVQVVPEQWGTVISPILVGMHLEVEGRNPKPAHDDAIIQWLLWAAGDAVFMWLVHMARVRPPVIPRRTMFWYLNKYGLRVKDIQATGMMYPNHRDQWVWTLPEVRQCLQDVDALVLEWYRLAYLLGEGNY
jgi:hypothetical protein